MDDTHKEEPELGKGLLAPGLTGPSAPMAPLKGVAESVSSIF